MDMNTVPRRGQDPRTAFPSGASVTRCAAVAALVVPWALATGSDTTLSQRNALAEDVEAIGKAAIGPDTSVLVVAVDVKGERRFARGFGSARDGLDGGTPFHAGSLLSCFLAVAALDEAGAGRLDLEASLAEHLAELPYGALGVRVDHLLAQTSGIPGYGDLLRASRHPAVEVDPERVLLWLRNGPLDSSPGSCASYSETNDLLLGLVLERVRGRSVSAQLEALFAAAGMDDTAFDGGEQSPAPPFEHEFAGAFEDRGQALPPFGAERLRSTANDLLRFQRALVEHRLLSPEVFERRAAPARLSDGSSADVGRGISLTSVGEQACHVAGGGIDGQRVLLAYFPAMDTTIVVWAAGDDPPVPQILARVARALFDLEVPVVRDLALAPEERARYVGDYYAGCTSYTVVDDEQHLVLHPPVGPGRRQLHQGGREFIADDDPDVRVEFESDGGRITAFRLTEHGIPLRARRLF